MKNFEFTSWGRGKALDTRWGHQEDLLEHYCTTPKVLMFNYVMTIIQLFKINLIKIHIH
jgi:hypothetical protein